MNEHMHAGQHTGFSSLNHRVLRPTITNLRNERARARWPCRLQGSRVRKVTMLGPQGNMYPTHVCAAHTHKYAPHTQPEPASKSLSIFCFNVPHTAATGSFSPLSNASVVSRDPHASRAQLKRRHCLRNVVRGVCLTPSEIAST